VDREAVKGRNRRRGSNRTAPRWRLRHLLDEVKALKLDSNTGSRYTEALEQHALEALGDFYFDALKATDVQKWIDDEFREGYKVSTVNGWFRVFRTMVRDHLAVLDLPRDPTMRISFPDPDDNDERNALGPEELNKFLEAMREKYPQHYPLVAVLAFTGLRFCHASALKWEDIDETAEVIRVLRKQVRGVVGNVSRRKRAPKEIPLHPKLAKILQQHRKEMIGAQAPGLSDGWCFRPRSERCARRRRCRRRGPRA
jgi:integrase